MEGKRKGGGGLAAERVRASGPKCLNVNSVLRMKGTREGRGKAYGKEGGVRAPPAVVNRG